LKGVILNNLEMTGLDLLQAMADGRLPHPSIADTMPMRLVEISKGAIKIYGAVVD